MPNLPGLESPPIRTGRDRRAFSCSDILPPITVDIKLSNRMRLRGAKAVAQFGMTRCDVGVTCCRQVHTNCSDFIRAAYAAWAVT